VMISSTNLGSDEILVGVGSTVASKNSWTPMQCELKSQKFWKCDLALILCLDDVYLIWVYM
jgi:hypothetical protein